MEFHQAFLVDKIGKEKVLVIGYVVFALSSILMTLFTSSNYLYAYLLALIFGVYMGISETVQRAVIPKYVSAELRGTAYGVYNLVSGVCFFVSNITFGYIWDNYNLNLATLIQSILFFLCYWRNVYIY